MDKNPLCLSVSLVFSWCLEKLPKVRYKLVASIQAEILFDRSIRWQRGRGFGALAQNIERSANLLLREYIVPAAKRVGADMVEFAVREIAGIVSRWKNVETAAKSVGKNFWENNWVVVARNEVQAESFQQNLQNKPVCREETFPQTFLINHVE